MFGLFRKKKPTANSSASFVVAYVYAWKEDVPESERDTKDYPSRAFCKKLMELGRVYTRADIETMSQRLGYSIWDRCGGDGCRHRWVSTIIEKK